jgi:hypothetical protein
MQRVCTEEGDPRELVSEAWLCAGRMWQSTLVVGNAFMYSCDEATYIDLVKPPLALSCDISLTYSGYNCIEHSLDESIPGAPVTCRTTVGADLAASN